MPKTSFSKSELNELHRILIKNKMFPVLDIAVYFDSLNSTKRLELYIITFATTNKQISVSFFSRDGADLGKLRNQLRECFIYIKRRK